MDIPIACIRSLNPSSSSTRAWSSAVEFSLRSQSPRHVWNLLEYHPEAPQWNDAITACYQVEEVPLRAAPEGPKSFLDIQCQVRDYVAVSIHLLFQFHSDDRFNRSYAMGTARGLRTFRA